MSSNIHAKLGTIIEQVRQFPYYSYTAFQCAYSLLRVVTRSGYGCSFLGYGWRGFVLQLIPTNIPSTCVTVLTSPFFLWDKIGPKWAHLSPALSFTPTMYRRASAFIRSVCLCIVLHACMAGRADQQFLCPGGDLCTRSTCKHFIIVVSAYVLLSHPIYAVSYTHLTLPTTPYV